MLGRLGEYGICRDIFPDFDPNPGCILLFSKKYSIGCETIDQDEEYAYWTSGFKICFMEPFLFREEFPIFCLLFVQ